MKKKKSDKCVVCNKEVENRCWACKKKIKDGKLFCKKCESNPDSRRSGVGTYVIYHKV